ncbi:hypothetical protein BJX76DRAFT_330308 [Aspergillus varians]
MLLKSFLLPALASLAAAESTVTSMFIINADKQPLAASIAGNDATATTYSINCPPGTPSDECGMGIGMTLVAGSETTTYIMNMGPRFQYTAKCSVGKSSAVCTESAGGPDANFPGVDTTTVDVDLLPVTVTAGKVTEGGSTATTTSAGSSSTDSTDSTTTTTAAGTTGRGSSTPDLATATGAANGTATATGADATSTGAAAAVRVAGGAGVVVGGVVAALVGAVL